MKFKIRLFDKFVGIFVCTFLGSGIKNPCINKPGKDGIQVVFKAMFFCDSLADPVKPQFIVNILKKQIAAIEAPPGIVFQTFNRGKINLDRGSFFFFRQVHESNLFLCPGFGICNTIRITDIFFRTEFFDNHGFIFSININGLLCVIKNGIFGA